MMAVPWQPWVDLAAETNEQTGIFMTHHEMFGLRIQGDGSVLDEER
jgi:hypothetical protein